MTTTADAAPPTPAMPSDRLSRRMGWTARRVIGVDLARGLAMIGMFGAHLHVARELTVADPSTWLALVHGRSAILFALLAGVSVALVTGGPRPISGPAVVDFRLRTFVRAAMLFAVAGVLTSLGTPVAIILESYAMLFVLLLLALGWSAMRLWTAVAVLSVLGPVLTFAARGVLMALDLYPEGSVGLLFGQFYPVATWIVFPLAGLAIGRTDLRSLAVQLRLLGAGSLAALLGYGAGHLSSELAARAPWLGSQPGVGEAEGSGSFVVVEGPRSVVGSSWIDRLAEVPASVLSSSVGAEPHSGTPFEVLGSGGFVIAVLGLCLLATRSWGRFPLAPVAALGSLSLTVYSVHVVAIWAMREAYWADQSLRHFAIFTVLALLAATAWRLALGKGPLERLITWVALRTARFTGLEHEEPAATPSTSR